MVGLGIELGDERDMNRYFPILKDTKYGIRRIGILSLYGAGTAAITIDGVGKTPFKTHDEALKRFKFI